MITDDKIQKFVALVRVADAFAVAINTLDAQDFSEAKKAIPYLLDEICRSCSLHASKANDLTFALDEAKRKLALLQAVVSCLHDKKGEWLGMHYVDDYKLMTAFNAAREGGALEG